MAMQTCHACGNDLADGATQCHACLVAVPEEQEVYDLSAETASLPPDWEGGAVYTLEFELSSWSELDWSTGVNADFDYPRRL